MYEASHLGHLVGSHVSSPDCLGCMYHSKDTRPPSRATGECLLRMDSRSTRPGPCLPSSLVGGTQTLISGAALAIVSSTSSQMSEEAIRKLVAQVALPADYDWLRPTPSQFANDPPLGYLTVYASQLTSASLIASDTCIVPRYEASHLGHLVGSHVSSPDCLECMHYSKVEASLSGHQRVPSLYGFSFYETEAGAMPSKRLFHRMIRGTSFSPSS
ncbi:hypothetical protein Salat_2619200 [Sesamum alatum]|uniref:Uncharacterized protein n=1 Tax=Sesamum alatum TaxID=300844 RepID=A0AAE1XNF0_9LAMI|nr:hypothetical protein Salat_2619200 [Sesamum alatum]